MNGSLSAGAISITAEEFNLTPSTEPGTGNQLSCSGRVEIHGEHFTARCSKLSVKNSDLLLEGTPEQPAEIVKTTKAPVDPNNPQSDASEFRLSAIKISFTLTLDKLQVGNGATVLPVPQPANKADDFRDEIGGAPIAPNALNPLTNPNINLDAPPAVLRDSLAPATIDLPTPETTTDLKDPAPPK